MNQDQADVLNALYIREEERFRNSNYDGWSSPQEIADALPNGHMHLGDATWARSRLEELWIMRKVLQVPRSAVNPSLVDVVLDSRDRHVPLGDGKLRREQNDCRGPSALYEQVAICDPKAKLEYRSRTAEIVRMLSFNYQRFNMAPATGFLRYELRRQRRPRREKPLQDFRDELISEIAEGGLSVELSSGPGKYALSPSVDRTHLSAAVKCVLNALELHLDATNPPLTQFQVNSVRATLNGLYSTEYLRRKPARASQQRWI